MEKKTLNKLLENALKTDCIQIIYELLKLNPEGVELINDWYEKNDQKRKEEAQDAEFINLWDERILPTVMVFNEYGGGDYREEDDAIFLLWELSKMGKEKNISWNARKMVMDSMMEQYAIGNSGFEDMLYEIASGFCDTEEEIEYFEEL